MSLARKQDHISGTRFCERERNRFAAIDFYRVFDSALLQAHQSIINDRSRILAARIVGSEYHKIAAASGCLAHKRTLDAIAIASTAEHRQDSPGGSPARNEFTSQRCQIAQSVVGVSVVDDDGKRLAAIDAFKSSRNVGQRLNAAGNR